ncbi:MAG: hypothetical protein ACKO1M_00695 [Planctomycetota bacterium]
MIIPGSRLAPFAVAALAAACLPAPVRGQVPLRIEAAGGIQVQVQGNFQVQGNGVAVLAGDAFAGGAPAGDPWWGECAAAAAPPVEPQAQAGQPAQFRLAQARRARAESMLVRELSRVREACPELQPAQRAAVLKAGRAAVEDQAAGRSPLANGVEQVLEQALEEAAGPEVAVVYAEEVASRVARRKAAAIAVIVETVDRDAWLDDDQRQALVAAMAQRWRPEWEGVAATALRQRITFARLPVGVADAVAAALDP